MPLWTEKYRPVNLTEYIAATASHAENFAIMIDNKEIPNLLLAGIQGTGKTTIAKILARSCADIHDILVVNASDDRGIDTFRETIKSFAMTNAMSSDRKIIHLEEADQLTPTTQTALKQFMEEVSDNARFILTCNTPGKIIPPIRSRCQEYLFQRPDVHSICERLIHILQSEKVKFTLDDLDSVVVTHYPDIRSMVNYIQQNSVSGTLQLMSRSSTTPIDGLFEHIKLNKWKSARDLVVQTLSPSEMDTIFPMLYNNTTAFCVGSNEARAIVIIAEHMYKHTFCADPEINIASMLISLCNMK
jgi:DNA polymerase III delta prime subunit